MRPELRDCSAFASTAFHATRSCANCKLERIGESKTASRPESPVLPEWQRRQPHAPAAKKGSTRWM
jgi:hypothetical protein